EARVQEKRIGNHLVRFTEPNLFHIEFMGDVSASELSELGDFFREAKDKVYLLVDASRIGSMSAEAKLVKKIPISAGSAVYGAGSKARLALSILNKVYMLVNLGKEIPLSFFETEPEARAWLDGIRASNG
ncbi:MAG: STAS/SEC14 domain-containing protein, partial [Polyangiaceae bacterium]